MIWTCSSSLKKLKMIQIYNASLLGFFLEKLIYAKKLNAGSNNKQSTILNSNIFFLPKTSKEKKIHLEDSICVAYMLKASKMT